MSLTTFKSRHTFNCVAVAHIIKETCKILTDFEGKYQLEQTQKGNIPPEIDTFYRIVVLKKFDFTLYCIFFCIQVIH